MENLNYEAFLKCYNEKFEPNLKKLEYNRLALEATTKSRLTIGIAILTACVCMLPLVCVIAIKLHVNQYIIAGVIPCLIASIIAIALKVLGYYATKNHAQSLKLKNKILALYGNYYFSDVLDLQLYRTIELFGLTPQFKPNKKRTRKNGTTVIGSHNNSSIVMHNCSLVREVSAGKYTFNGLIIKYKTMTKFEGTTVIAKKNHINAKTFNMKFGKLDMPDNDFLKNRTVYTTNKIETANILTPELLELITKLESNSLFGSANVADIIITGETIFIIIDSDENLFNIDLTKKLTSDKDLFWNIYSKLNAVSRICDYFKNSVEKA